MFLLIWKGVHESRLKRLKEDQAASHIFDEKPAMTEEEFEALLSDVGLLND